MNSWLHQNDIVLIDRNWFEAALYRMTKWPNYNVINLALRIGVFVITRKSKAGNSVDLLPATSCSLWKKNSHLNASIGYHANRTPITFCFRQI
jgi:hypothetical protein